MLIHRHNIITITNLELWARPFILSRILGNFSRQPFVNWFWYQYGIFTFYIITHKRHWCPLLIFLYGTGGTMWHKLPLTFNYLLIFIWKLHNTNTATVIGVPTRLCERERESAKNLCASNTSNQLIGLSILVLLFVFRLKWCDSFYAPFLIEYELRVFRIRYPILCPSDDVAAIRYNWSLFGLLFFV